MTGGDPVAGRDHRRRASASHVAPPGPGSAPEGTPGGPADERRVAAVVLAAGAATRFGATKQTADLAGWPLVAHVVRAAHEAGVDRVHLVVGHDADAVVAAARVGGDVEVVPNDDHADGQATSLRAGIRAAAAGGAAAAVVLLADEPDVTAAAVEQVGAAVLAGAPAARAAYDDGVGHPVAFAAATFPRVLEVHGDRGARDLLAGLGVVDVPIAGGRPRDLDRPEDLDARRRR